jgi:hypothetical protein
VQSLALRYFRQDIRFTGLQSGWRVAPDVTPVCARPFKFASKVEEGWKCVLVIVAGILVARHLKNSKDLHESRPSPRTESLIASAVQWTERIMRRIDGLGR